MSGDSNILVTVLLPVYNAEEYVRESLASVVDQTYTNLEILVIDDGCTDGSIDIVRSFEDDRIRLVQNEKNLGLIGTLNKGLGLASGKYIVRADADDRCIAERVEKQVQFMESNPHIGISGTAYGNFGEEYGHVVTTFATDHDEIMFRHLYQIHLMHGTSIWRMSIFKEHGFQFDPIFKHSEDYDLFDRVSQISTVANLTDCLYEVRMHADRISFRFSDIQQANSNIVRRRGFERMGVSVADDQIALFRDFCHRDFDAIRGKENDIADLLNDMLVGNSSKKYIDQALLVRLLKESWEALCLANSRGNRQIHKLLTSHPISKQLKLSKISIAKTLVKSVIK